jgi:hypothetical protein
MDFGRYVMYAYEEGAAPSAFFVPFAWEAAVGSCADLAWDSSYRRVTLFDHAA